MIEIEDLKKLKNIHLIGIGGISMSAIAETLHSWGYNVTGSDANQSDITDKLNAHGIKTTIGHSPEDSKNADLIIYSAAIKDDDPDMIAGKEANIPLIIRGEFVGLLTKMYKEAICVSGTHGKSTTTSMLSVCFLTADADPTIQVGAYLKNIDGNYYIGKSEYFILESCEYKESFLDFFPNTAIILNIDNDHLDYYKTFDNVIKAFQKFTQKLTENDLLVVNADDKNCLDLTNITKSKYLKYGIENTDANFTAKNITFDDNGFASYDCYKNGNLYAHISLSVSGYHNVLNSLACLTTCDYYNLDKEKCISALKSFTGASRRLEYKGEVNGAPIFDDYGHHPTEIEAIGKAILNKKYNKSWVVFQPHTYSRTKEHLHHFAESLSSFDNIILVDIYAAREKNEIGISSKDLADEIEKLGHKAIYMPKFDEVVDYLKENVKENDLVLTLGAGTVTEIGPMLVE